MSGNQTLEFWGVEVKSGQSLVVEPDEKVVHLSQACLAEVKKAKGTDPISLFVKTGNQKLVFGVLSAEKFPQLLLDIVFDKKFELSHNCKSGSVHFTGYKAVAPRGDDSSGSDEDEPLTLIDNGKPKVSTEEAKKAVKSEKKEASSDDDSSDDEEFIGNQAKNEEDSSEYEDESDSDDDVDSEDEADDSSEEDEETPKKADLSKKRPAESTKTPANDKKAKFVTPEKTGSKKGSVHTATPHPAKQAGKKAATSDNSKSAGAFHCQPCNRSFNTDGALQSHTKAKHGAAK